MNKIPFKILTCSALIATITATSVLPTNVFAETKSSQVNVHVKKDISNYPLGPEGLKEAMHQTGSNVLVMDLYALTLIKQPNFDFKNIKSIDTDLSSKIINHQRIAQSNANEWLDKLKPGLIQTNENIINYNTQFQNYYNTLLSAVDTNNSKTLKTGINRLYNSILGYQKQVDQLLQQLQEYRGKLMRDTQNFKGDTDRITSILAGESAGIPSLKAQIETHNNAIADANIVASVSTAAVMLGPLMVGIGICLISTGFGAAKGAMLITAGLGGLGGGGAGLVLVAESIESSQKQIKKLTTQLTDAEVGIVVLTTVKDQTTFLAQTVDHAINSLQNISDQWHTMGSKYQSLLQNVSNISPEELVFIKEDLKTAKDSWQNIKEFADKLYGEVKYESKEI
ncbi:non-hemolytic enterotoxin subunit B [Bacillus mycoides]|uniref:non-hemolytic enterotoxin subunit B n=1 Tax=Bacillus mycoides TaxID=1405 RepID=UPI0037F43477